MSAEKCVYKVIHFNIVFSLMYSLNCGFLLKYVLFRVINHFRVQDSQCDNFVTIHVVVMTNYGDTSDDKIVELTIFCFQLFGTYLFAIPVKNFTWHYNLIRYSLLLP